MTSLSIRIVSYALLYPPPKSVWGATCNQKTLQIALLLHGASVDGMSFAATKVIFFLIWLMFASKNYAYSQIEYSR